MSNPLSEPKCPTCGEPTTQIGTVLGHTYTVSRACRCKREEIAAWDEAEQHRNTTRLLRANTRRCFGNASFSAFNFAQDDNADPKASRAARTYANSFAAMQADNMGLLFYGPPGTGKSFLAACIATALLQQGHTAIMTNFTTAVQTLQNNFGGQAVYIRQLATVSLLILDDLGVERSSEYMMEQVFNIVDARYRARKPMIITTNLPIEEIKRPRSLSHQRIYDRVLEVCHPIKMQGPSRRREALRQNYPQRNKKLGIE